MLNANGTRVSVRGLSYEFRGVGVAEDMILVNAVYTHSLRSSRRCGVFKMGREFSDLPRK